VRGLQLAGALVLQALACGYYGIFAGLVVGLGVLLFAASRSLWRLPRYWIAVGVAAAAALAAVAPFYVLYANVQREFGFSRTIEDAAMYSANWPAWLASSSVAHRWLHPLLGSRWSEVLFPGFLTTGLGVAGAWLSWRKAGRSGPGAASALEFRSRDTIFFYVVIAVLAFWLSFGPSAGLYAVFFEIVPAFSLLRAPARFALLVTLALSALMAMGLAGWMASQTPGRRRIAGRLLAAALTLELASVPLAMPEVEPFNDAYRFLATARPGPVAEFPFFYYRPDYPRHTTYMLNSTAHWQPLVNG
jgi:hypothetical protein